MRDFLFIDFKKAAFGWPFSFKNTAMPTNNYSFNKGYVEVKSCSNACHQDQCEEVCGEYKFTAPATIYSFNALSTFNVYQVIDSEEHCVGTFGGRKPYQHKYEIAGNYIIKWCIKGRAPDCVVDKPVFHVHVETASRLFTASFRNKGADLYFAGWILVMNDDVANAKWMDQEGNELSKADHVWIDD